jgi:hypothetical protein
MQKFRVWWNSFKTVAILISFVTNMVLLLVLLLLLMQLFQIKNGILEPLIDGLHRNFVGLDEAVIVRTIEVNDQIPVVFDLPLDQQTNVVLTQDVPIAANATFTLPGGGGVINGRVDLVLPKDLVLPVQLNLVVPVNTEIPISLPVDVEIPLNETQLHAPFYNLRYLLEPYVTAMDNLPGSWGDVPDFMIDAIQGEGIYLLTPTEGSQHPWPGPEAYEVERSGDTMPGDSGGADAELSEEFAPPPTATPVQDIGIITPPGQ